MSRTSNRGRNNNPTGRNQYSSDWMSTVKERPMTAAAVAAASVGAGVFLWSKRNQISEQLSNLSDQISEWTESMRSGDLEEEFATGGAATGSTSSRSTGSRSTSTRSKSSSGMSETGGGNASLGAHTGSGSGAIS
ncbi:hypothetical protein H9L14_06855 [Sphingomonas sediminicola]|uniref:YtxH domain-containing protein n=1 Tax=Sphingomonas sediminicola TaxID=386874 RepID=A0ABX6TA84_9SPHN|nr:hypothetical protein [Sphingomonas sediminicola]QNP46766.1 hypothetical protein H9L14_06855 [Sphingomonas sediminicola]